MLDDYKYISNDENLDKVKIIEVSPLKWEDEYPKFDNELEKYVKNNSAESYCLNFLNWNPENFKSRTFESMLLFHELCDNSGFGEACFLLPKGEYEIVHSKMHLDDKFKFFYSVREFIEYYVSKV